jgi:hypothetical protein
MVCIAPESTWTTFKRLIARKREMRHKQREMKEREH